MEKILIIDDNAFELAILKDILKDKFQIVTAQDGHSGFETAIKESPTLILLDIVMRGIDGFETLLLLKDNEATMSIPVIFLTAIDDEQVEEKGFLAGAVDYIRKPYNPNIVMARVRNQINIYNYRRMIESQLSIDGLTGVHNRRDFQKMCSQFWEQAKLEKVPFSFVILDIDFFKRVNDTYGHMTGDSVLISLANVLKASVPDDNAHYVARYGGEEFVVFLYNTTAEEGKAYAEKLRQEVQALNIPNEKSDVAPVVTISVGGNTRIPEGDEHVVEFIVEADQNLYSAKQTGRNKVVWNS